MVQFIFHLRRELSVPVSSVTIKKIAEYSGTDFEHVEFEPILLKDAEGVNHEFHFTVRHLGDRIGIDSFEIDEDHRGGYEFSLIGDIEDEIFKLFGKLFERMRKALERKHIEWDDTTNRWQISEEDVVRARISSDLENDENYGHPPLIVIDGYLLKFRTPEWVRNG
jgi:hypothetical protein